MLGLGPTQGRGGALNRVGFEPATFGLDHRRSADWAAGPERGLAVGVWGVVHKDKGQGQQLAIT